MRISTSQAPSRNLVMQKTSITTAVQRAPKLLMTIFMAQRRSKCNNEPRSRTSWSGCKRPILYQRRAMPACERVNDKKTPMAPACCSR